MACRPQSLLSVAANIGPSPCHLKTGSYSLKFRRRRSTNGQFSLPRIPHPLRVRRHTPPVECPRPLCSRARLSELSSGDRLAGNRTHTYLGSDDRYHLPALECRGRSRIRWRRSTADTWRRVTFSDVHETGHDCFDRRPGLRVLPGFRRSGSQLDDDHPGGSQ